MTALTSHLKDTIAKATALLLLWWVQLAVVVIHFFRRTFTSRPVPKTFQQKKDSLLKQYRVFKERNEKTQVALGGKKTTNLFRVVSPNQKRFRLNVRDFNEVIRVDAKNRFCEVEGMTTYEDLVAATLAHGLMPTVVPELKSITIGGAVVGVGVESSSFRYGFVHETILEMEVLLANGEVLTCTPDNEHSDLFFAIPNSYGTFGYILRLKVKLIPVKKYVQVRHLRYNSMEHLFRDFQTFCDPEDNEIDFVDGVAFTEDEMYITLGKFVDRIPNNGSPSSYRYMNIYYKSLQEKNTDYLTVLDYIWRWDTDWFWCSRYFYMQHWFLRWLLGLWCLKSTIYMSVWRWYLNAGLYKQPREFVIQDVEIPLDNCENWLRFFHREIGIKPVWMCPVRSYDRNQSKFPLYKVIPGQLMINFGFWDSVDSNGNWKGYFNRKIEKKVAELHGRKSLYSSSYYPEDEFWQEYNKEHYDLIKAKYDPGKAFPNLYEKTCAK